MLSNSHIYEPFDQVIYAEMIIFSTICYILGCLIIFICCYMIYSTKLYNNKNIIKTGKANKNIITLTPIIEEIPCELIIVP